MKSFIRCCTSTHVAQSSKSLCGGTTTTTNILPVLPFLAPAVYYHFNHHTVARKQSLLHRERRGGGGGRQLSRERSAANREGTAVVQGLRLKLETDVADITEPDPAGTRRDELAPFRSIALTDDEVDSAYANMRAVMAREEEEDMALEVLTRKDRRVPKYVYAVVPDAIRAVERQIGMLAKEVEMEMHHLMHMREQRSAARHLLAGGRSVEAITTQYQLIAKTVDAADHFKMCMSYLVLYRQLFRLSGTVLEVLGTSIAPRPSDIGKAYHMLVSERLKPFVDRDRNSETRRRMEQVAEDLVGLLVRMLEKRTNVRRIIVPQPALHLLTQMASPSVLAALYWKLVSSRVRVREFTAFHFVSRLAQPDAVTGISLWSDGLAILKSMKYRVYCNLATVQAKHAFLGVLYQAMRANDAATTEEILKLMRECKLEPGVEVYNMLMARAAETADEDALKRYFDAITDSGYQPTMVSYSISHSFYKHHHNERERLLTIEKASAIDSRLNLFLATDILHAAVMQEKPYSEVYRRFRFFFHTKMLKAIGLAPDISGGLPGPQNKINPDHVTLAVMLSSYCNTERDVAKIWELYKVYQIKLYDQSAPNRWFRHMLLKAGSYIPHAIMMGLGKRIQGLPYVAAVLEDMLKPHAAVESDVYSWSIFLHFLTLAGKIDEAETVVKVMRSRGLSPNSVTFTTLLNGYVRKNMTEQAEDVLKRMEEAGVAMNVYTWTSLLHGYVKNEENWKAGDVFRRMLDSAIQPDEATLQAVSGITDRRVFEAGLEGQEVDEEGNIIETPEGERGRVGKEEEGEWFDDGKELPLLDVKVDVKDPAAV